MDVDGSGTGARHTMLGDQGTFLAGGSVERACTVKETDASRLHVFQPMIAMPAKVIECGVW